MTRGRADLKRPGRRAPAAIAVTLVVGLCVAMAWTPARQLLAQRERIAAAAGDLSETRALNRRLVGRIERLHDPDFIEQRARSEIGLVYPGETTYVVMPPSRQVQDKRRERVAAVAPETVAEPSVMEAFLDFMGLGWAL